MISKSKQKKLCWQGAAPDMEGWVAVKEAAAPTSQRSSMVSPSRRWKMGF
jgi:hypothetical protein